MRWFFLTVKKIKMFPDFLCTLDILFCMEYTYIILKCHPGVENMHTYIKSRLVICLQNITGFTSTRKCL